MPEQARHDGSCKLDWVGEFYPIFPAGLARIGDYSPPIDQKRGRIGVRNDREPSHPVGEAYRSSRREKLAIGKSSDAGQIVRGSRRALGPVGAVGAVQDRAIAANEEKIAVEGANPGWSATVNGEPAPIHRADYNFRAVSLPAGRSTVCFSYRPQSLRIGLYFCAAGILALVAAWFRPSLKVAGHGCEGRTAAMRWRRW
jgi:hypothetical protein